MSNNRTFDVKLQDEFATIKNAKVVLKNQIIQAKLITGLERLFVHIKLKLSHIKIAMNCYDNPLDWLKSLQYLIKLRRKFLGNYTVQKMVKADEKYYLSLYTPGWNSKIFENFITAELNNYKHVKQQVNRFNTVIIAITNKCTLQCEHCFEWDNLNKKDILSVDKLISIVAKIQEKGVSQIQFSGGEPLLKMDTLVQILNEADKQKTEFWVDTSGFKLTINNAEKLKTSGLNGVIISLDHYIPEKHNTFRGFNKAYYWVEKAIKNARDNNLIVALSLCVRRDFVTNQNLMAYMELAKSMKVSFVQLLEPKAVGHYIGKDVSLRAEQIQLLEDFFLKMNFNVRYNSFPLISYRGYFQRRHGCFSAGKKSIYIDSDGQINSCPFCHNKIGHVLDSHFDENLLKIKSIGCNNFNDSLN